MNVFIFWLSVFLIVYTNFLYPGLVFILLLVFDFKKSLAFLFKKVDWRIHEEKIFYPKVSIAVPAYNEGRVIEEKIRNFLSLDYPKEQLEMLIGSDGSTDDTEEKVMSSHQSNVRLLKFPRRGKAGTINDLIKEARGEIVILSDAAAMLSPDSVKKLTRHFGSSDVGCVRGEIRMESEEGAREEDLYMRFETLLKYGENKLGIVLGASGAIYALRKELFDPLPENTINDDFLIPMRIVERGYKVMYDSQAQAYEKPPKGLKVEFHRRVRIGAGAPQLLRLTWRLLDPRKGLVAFTYFSHKILRWLCPYLLIAAFLSNLALFDAKLYRWMFGLQLVFYILVFIGYLRKDKPKPGRFFSMPFYFVYFNLALLAGNLSCLKGTKRVGWERTER